MFENNKVAPLSFKEKVGYGVGDMASNFYMGVFGVFLLYYYTDVYGISPGAAALMFIVTKLIDAVSDPAMGILADRTQTRWGKYRPYLIWMALPYAALGYLLFLGPDLSETGKLIFIYVSYSLVMLAYTAINVPYSALLAVIHPSAAERAKATQFRFIFASLGTLVVTSATWPLVGLLGGENELLGFRLTILIFALLSVVLFVITFATTRERIEPTLQKTSVAEDAAVLLKNISWIVLALSGILIVVGLIARISSTIHFVKYVMPVEEGTFFLWMDRATLIVTLGFVGQLIGALITPTLLQFSDKRKLMIAACGLNGAAFIACYFLPPSAYWPILALHAVGIFSFGIMITLLFAMYTDCAEYGEWISGKNSAGLTVSASMFSLKAGSAIGSAVPGFLLAMFGFVANEVQTEQAVLGIQLMYNIVPAVFFLAAGALMIFYRIDRPLLSRIEADLAERRQARAG